jgi:hypothetical protein
VDQNGKSAGLKDSFGTVTCAYGLFVFGTVVAILVPLLFSLFFFRA